LSHEINIVTAKNESSIVLILFIIIVFYFYSNITISVD